MSWLGSWQKRIPITVDNTNIDADLTHFPITLILDSSAGTGAADVTPVFDALGSNSQKIAVTEGDGTTELYVEVERWDSVNEIAVLHVSRSDYVLDADASSTLYLYYDNTHADNTSYVGTTIGSSPATNVWDADYVAVLHLSESGNGTANEYKDSTSNGNHGTGASGAYPDRADGKVGYGQTCDEANNEHITIPNLATAGSNLANTFTCTAYINLTNADEDRHICTKGGTTDANGRKAFTVNTSAKLQWNEYGQTSWEGTSAISTGAWTHIGTSYNPTGDAMKSYINGAVDKSGTYNLNQNGDPSPSNFYVGAAVNGLYGFHGGFDEFRFSDVVRTDAWVKAEYYTLSDGLVAYGTAEDKPVSNIVSRVTVLKSSTSNLVSTITSLLTGSDNLVSRLTSLVPSYSSLVARVSVATVGDSTLVCRVTVINKRITNLVCRLSVRQTATADLKSRISVVVNSSTPLVSRVSVVVNATTNLISRVNVRQRLNTNILSRTTVLRESAASVISRMVIRKEDTVNCTSRVVVRKMEYADGYLVCQIDVWSWNKHSNTTTSWTERTTPTYIGG